MSRQERSPYRLSKLLKSVRQDNLHAQVGDKRAMVRMVLDRFQIAGLKKLAKTHGTTVGTELSNAVDAYLLGLNRDEIRFFGLFGDLIRFYQPKINRKLTEALLKTDKSFARIARMERQGIKARRKKQA